MNELKHIAHELSKEAKAAHREEKIRRRELEKQIHNEAKAMKKLLAGNISCEHDCRSMQRSIRREEHAARREHSEMVRSLQQDVAAETAGLKKLLANA